MKNYHILYEGGTSTSVTMDPVWNWISMVDRLANGDITKHEQIYETNYIECLNLLAFWSYKDKYHQQIEKLRR